MPTSIADRSQPAVLYNGMIAPLAPYPVRGAIWYQGERNANGGNAYEYRYLLPTIISSWRTLWEQPDMPFFLVQLPEFEAPEEGTWPVLRESMLQTWQTTPHTGMAVTIGLGNPRQIHPRRKKPVGQRLAWIALAQVYGRDVVWSGPVYRTMHTVAHKACLNFDHLESPLAPGDEPLSGFEIAGPDRKFVPAQARVDGDQVVVWSDGVATPIAVRYAWANHAQPSLFNQAGLPASPFRTDAWPVVSEDKINPPPLKSEP
jgi:sialate O-acetylesterase